jgi:hypothetical protein
MSSNSAARLIALVALLAGPGVAAPVACPSSIGDGAAQHRLTNASIFDGPPEEKADLVPDSSGRLDLWKLEGVDAYLVCRFAGTERVVTLHAVGAKICEAGAKPFRATCRD